MRLLYWSAAFFLSLPHHAFADPVDDDDTPAAERSTPCTITSAKSGAFFDLNPLHIIDPALSTAANPRNYSWNTTGFDMGYNFTLNFCGGVVEDLTKRGVVGVHKEDWKNVSAFYEQDGKIYSIGQTSYHPIIRGRKLILNYTNGSPCPERSNFDEDGEGNGDGESKHNSRIRRKTTIISMLCERDPLYPKLTLSFIASPDECTYIFEARTKAGCAGIETTKQELSPSGVFGVIALVAVIVYVVGGCVYSRMVLNQRGWKQLPNYGLWAGILGVFRVFSPRRHLTSLLQACQP